MHCGDTVLIPAPGSDLTPHLWIIVTEPVQDTHLCVIVNVTTLRNSQDRTVTLSVGDHPFIRHQSSVRYSDGRFADVRRLRADLAAGTAARRDPCTPQLLRLVQDGIIASPYTPKKIVNYCHDLWRQQGR